MSEQREMTARDRARSAAFKDEGENPTVEHNGVVYEIRPLSAAQDRSISHKARIKVGDEWETDGHKRMMLGYIESVYVLETGEKVWDAKDLDFLMSRPIGPKSILNKLAKAVARANKAEQEDAAGKSVSPDTSSSTD